MSNPNFQQLLDGVDLPVSYDCLEYIGGGFSSSVYGDEAHIVKLLNTSHQTRLAAGDWANMLHGEQALIAEFLGEGRVAMARFVVGSSDDGEYKVLLVQERIQGVTMAEALAVGEDPSTFSEYLIRGLQMYGRVRKIPDFSCVERKFDPLSDPNTVVCNAQPVLVDTTFGRTQRRPLLGKVIHAGIAYGTSRALKALE